MSFSSQKNLPPTNGLASQSTLQSCTWSAHAPQSGPSPLPLPRSGHSLTAAATGPIFLFGGWAHGRASSDLYVFSTRDFSTTLLQTSGEVPAPRARHGAAHFGTTLLIFGGKTNPGDQHLINHDSLYLLNLVSREWTRVVVNGPGPNDCLYHSTTMVGSKLVVFGGKIGWKTTNDIWTLDVNCLKSQPRWESFPGVGSYDQYEPTAGNEKPLPRADHVSITIGWRIIVFGGNSDQNYYNDTWSFDISTRKWTELQCTGSIPSPRASHAAILVDGVIYVFGGFSMDEGYLDDLYALQLSTQRWFKFHNVGSSPHRRSHHSMASDGTLVFVLGGYSKGARSEGISLIHHFDTKQIKYPDPERNAVTVNEKTTQLVRKSSTGPSTLEQPQHLKPSSSEAHRASHLQNENATPAVSGRSAPLELTGVDSKPRRVPEDDVGEGSTEYRAKFVAPHSFSEGEVTRLEPERHPSVSLAAQTEQDQRIAQLTNELALKSARFEQAEANAVEAARRTGLEPREHTDDRRLMQTSPVKQRDVEVVDVQARLSDMQAKLDGLLLSHNQQIGQYDRELANVRAKLEAKDSELEAARRLRLTDVEKNLTKSRGEADTLNAPTATSSVNRDEDQITRRLMERVRALEAEIVSKRWNGKSIEEMECTNED